MNIALWIAAGLLAVAFLAAGLAKLVQPREKLASNMGWVEDFSDGPVKLIGLLEVLGAVGLILPAITKIVPILVPLPTQGTEGRIYIAINGQNWLSSTSMLAVSAEQIEAMRPSVQQRFAVAVARGRGDTGRVPCCVRPGPYFPNR